MKMKIKNWFNSDNGYYIEQHESSCVIYHNYIIFGIHGTSKVTKCTNEQLPAWLEYLNCNTKNTTSNFELNFN